MTKINSAYQFLIHPLHKQEDRTHDRAKRVLSLVASIAAGVFSLGSAHIIVYALHRHEIKKLNPDDRAPSEESEHSATSNEDSNSESGTSSGSSSSSSSQSSYQPSSQSSSKSSSKSSSSSSSSSSDNPDDLIFAQRLQEAENRRKQAEEATARREEENRKMQADPDADLAAAIAQSLREAEAAQDADLPDLTRRPQEQDEPIVPDAGVGQADRDADLDAAMALSLGQAEEAQDADLAAAVAQSVQPVIPNPMDDDLFNIYTTIESKLSPEELMTISEELLKTANNFEDIKEGMRHLAAAANKDHLVAQVQVASIFKFGSMPGIPKDMKLSRHYFQLAAERNNAVAQLEYADLLENGLGGPKLLGEAKHWYERSAQQNHLPSLFCLGCYIAEHEHDTAGAIPYYERAASQGFLPALIALGVIYYKENNMDRAEELFLNALIKADVPAPSFKLADGKFDFQKMKEHYQHPKEREEGLAEALRFNALVESYAPIAHFYLGKIYEEAEGKIDIQKAVEHYEKAGKYTDAKERLNALVEVNSPTTPAKPRKTSFYQDALIESEEELKRYTTDADNGDREAQNALSVYWEDKDPELAQKYLELAAKQYFPEAQLRLALKAKEAGEVETALRYLHLAAEQEFAPAYFELGDLYETVKPEEARQWFEKGAERKEPKACERVADSCKETEPKRAFQLYLIAAGKGLDSANIQLVNCYRDGIGTEKNIPRAIKLMESLVLKHPMLQRVLDDLRSQL
ncbi:MAG: SEL1-like repeat protein [Parachlamydiaceae bacterium]